MTAAAPLVLAVTGIEEARAASRAARELGLPLRLASPRGAVRQTGAAFYRALSRELGEELVIDCDDAAGFALEAIRLGARDVVFRGDADVRRRLDAMARTLGGRVRSRLPGTPVRPRPGEPVTAALARVAAGRGDLSLPPRSG